MSKKKNIYNADLAPLLEKYAKFRLLDFYRYSPYHLRITDPDYTILDCWTSNKYWIMRTNYRELIGEGIFERNNEKGLLPTDHKELFIFLDKIFYATELN